MSENENKGKSEDLCFVKIDLSKKIIEQNGDIPFRTVEGYKESLSGDEIKVCIEIDGDRMNLILRSISAAYMHGASLGAGSAREYYENEDVFQKYEGQYAYSLKTKSSEYIYIKGEVRGKLKYALLENCSDTSFDLKLSSGQSELFIGNVSKTDGRWILKLNCNGEEQLEDISLD